jgi:hypothetical protein
MQFSTAVSINKHHVVRGLSQSGDRNMGHRKDREKKKDKGLLFPEIAPGT